LNCSSNWRFAPPKCRIMDEICTSRNPGDFPSIFVSRCMRGESEIDAYKGCVVPSLERVYGLRPTQRSEDVVKLGQIASSCARPFSVLDKRWILLFRASSLNHYLSSLSTRELPRSASAWTVRQSEVAATRGFGVVVRQGL